MDTNMAGFIDGFQIFLRHCDLDECSLSIGRVKLASFNLHVSSIYLSMSKATPKTSSGC